MAEVALSKVVKAYGGNEVIHGIDLEISLFRSRLCQNA